MIDPDSQGGAEWRGDVEDGREVHQTPVKEPSSNAGADALREAFEAVRWEHDSQFRQFCTGCGRYRRRPEVHAPGCPVGKAVR